MTATAWFEVGYRGLPTSEPERERLVRYRDAIQACFEQQRVNVALEIETPVRAGSILRAVAEVVFSDGDSTRSAITFLYTGEPSPDNTLPAPCNVASALTRRLVRELLAQAVA